MGFWKQRHLEQAANYFSAPPGYVVCGQCVGDEALAAFIVEHAEDDTCSFCGRTAEEPIAASTDDVLAFIGSSLKKEWDIPENVLFHDSESPTGYFGPTPWTTEEALEQERDPIETPAFAEFVHDAFRDTQWIPRDPYALDEREALVFSWENFAETVKYQTRFVFTLLPDDGGQDDPRAPVRKGTRFLEEIAGGGV